MNNTLEILIEPQWNVDREHQEEIKAIFEILIEPQWNVDEDLINQLRLRN